jgi:hypothetical protein
MLVLLCLNFVKEQIFAQKTLIENSHMNTEVYKNLYNLFIWADIFKIEIVKL